MNFIKKFIGSSPTDEVAVIPSGKLFLTRSPHSPKGELECLYNDAFASIRQTTTPFYYQLCITRAYQEGELDNHRSSGFNDSDDDDDFEDDDGLHSIADVNLRSSRGKDEWNFDIISDIKVHLLEKVDGSRAICWKDLNGDIGDKFEFVIDEEVKLNEVDSFVLSLHKCLYEQKYQKSAIGIDSISQLTEFLYNPRSDLLTFEDLKKQLQFDSDNNASEVDDADGYDYHSDDSSIDEFYDAQSDLNSTRSSRSIYKEKTGKVIYKNTNFDIHLFDPKSGTFKLESSTQNVSLRIVEVEKFKFVLDVKSQDDDIFLSVVISPNMSPNFNLNYLYFIFNTFIVNKTESSAKSWLLRFTSAIEFSKFQEWFTRVMWESLNGKSWDTTDDVDHDYVLDSFSNLSLSEEDVSREEIEDMSEDDTSSQDIRDILHDREDLQYHGDEDREEEEDVDTYKNWKVNEDKNSILAVGYANNRSYVVRGDKLGVFKNDEDELYYQTTISNLQDLSGKPIKPKKLMLHQQDQYMVISDKNVDDTKLYKMDLHKGQIVEEWEMRKDTPVVSYGPNSKFSQLSAEQTLTGVSSNSIYQIDPRLSNSKFVSGDKFKQYKSKNNFSTLATTEQGYLAVGSEKGDIRLYDKIGPDATSILPSLGEPIVGLDVSNSGRWLLATCKSYLLLIDTQIGNNQTNAGHSGFTRYFNRDKKPTPRRLALKTEHIAYMLNETNQTSLNFTTAHFNTGLTAKEDTIVTSTGPYIITWSLKKVLLGKPDPYKIKRYSQNIIADDFIFGSNQNVVLAMQDDVSVVKKQALKKPSHSSVRKN